MTTLTVLDSRDILGKTVTAYGTVDEPLFLAKDVAEWIEHSNHRAMLDSVDEDEKIKLDPGVSIPYAGGDKEQWFLTEDGLYEVLMTSRLPIAKMFRKGLKQFLRDVRTGKILVSHSHHVEQLEQENAVLRQERDIDRQKLQVFEEHSNLSAKEREIYERDLKILWDNYAVLKTATDKSFAEGHAEGETAKAVEIARTMKQKGLATALIAEMTGSFRRGS
jgi:prophage antirepressor-like protein